MPSSIIQGFYEMVLQGGLEIGCYYIGRVVVPVLSFGRWKCDRITANKSRRTLRASGLYRMDGNKVSLTVQATQLVGLVCIVFLIAGGVVIWNLTKK